MTNLTTHGGACTCPVCAPTLWAAGIKGVSRPAAAALATGSTEQAAPRRNIPSRYEEHKERAWLVLHNLRSGKVVKEIYMSEDNALRRADELDAEGKMARVKLLVETSADEPSD